MKRILQQQIKPFALSLTLVLPLAFLYNNCSGKGFTVLGGGDTNLASSGDSGNSENNQPSIPVKSALTYGLKGDGVTDEYDAFQKMAADISGKQFTQRQIVYFPKGTSIRIRSFHSISIMQATSVFRDLKSMAITIRQLLWSRHRC